MLRNLLLLKVQLLSGHSLVRQPIHCQYVPSLLLLPLQSNLKQVSGLSSTWSSASWSESSWIRRFGSQNGCSVVPNTWLNREVTMTSDCLTLLSLSYNIISFYSRFIKWNQPQGLHHPWPLLHHPWLQPEAVRRQHARQHGHDTFWDFRIGVRIVGGGLLIVGGGPTKPFNLHLQILAL